MPYPRSAWRIAALCCVLLAAASAAVAQDLDQPQLRGSNVYEPAEPPVFRWAGLYGGAQIGSSSTQVDFSRGTRDLVAYTLRETALENSGGVSQWQTLGDSGNQATRIGGFVGFNAQWDDAVLGLELNYNRGPFAVTAVSTPITRALSAGGNAYVVTLNGAADMTVTDFGTIRGRGGYVFGRFMPYAVVGLALARADINRSVSITGTENGGAFAFSQADARRGVFLYGLAAGFGVDVAIAPNAFLRAEYEIIQFAPTSNIAASISTFRVGAGLKF